MTIETLNSTPKQHEPVIFEELKGEHQREPKDTKEHQSNDGIQTNKSVESKREYLKAYYLINSEKIKTQANEWNAKNRERRLNNQRNYRAQKLDIIKAKQKARIKCDCCGCDYSRAARSSHFKSRKHRRNLEIFNNNALTLT